MRRRIAFAVAGLAIVVALLAAMQVVTVIARKHHEAHWIGKYPPLKMVERGMDKATVLRILGQASAVHVNVGMSEGFRGTGEMGAQIKETWVFEPRGWNGSIELYLGADGRVVAVNHGYD